MCGAVRYECTAEPIFMGNCHCRDCQQASGSAYAAAIGVPQSVVKITGNVKARYENGQRSTPAVLDNHRINYQARHRLLKRGSSTDAAPE